MDKVFDKWTFARFQKVLSLAFGVCMLSFTLTACGDSSDDVAGGSAEEEGIIAIKDKTVSGVSQKGPFVNGSSVTVQELDGETLSQTGNSFEGKIKNDRGEFSVSVKSLASQYVLLKATGFYRNEVTGEKSSSQVTLYALTDLSERSEVNVNLLTHLEYERSLYLVENDSMSVADAKAKAETEVMNAFKIKGEFKNAEDLNIFGVGDENAALLAISVMMQGNLNEANFSERLADFAQDIEDGEWNDGKMQTEIADWTFDENYAQIRTHINSWNLGDEVPAFEKYLNNFWWQNFGLGDCSAENQSEIKQNSNELSAYYENHFICAENGWRIATDLEKDTYKWEAGNDGDSKWGSVNGKNCYVFEGKAWRAGNNSDCSLNLRGCTVLRQDTVGLGSDKVWHICDAQSWRSATTYEKDTYRWVAGNDGDSKWGSVNGKNCYVFEEKAWRAGNNSDCSLELRGCTTLRQDTVGLGSDKVWHICDAQSWRNATDIEKDTATWGEKFTEGDVRNGSVNTSFTYVFNGSNWRRGTILDSLMVKNGGLACAEKKNTTNGKIAVYKDTSSVKIGNLYYVCSSGTATLADTTYRWMVAPNVYNDTYESRGECANATDGDLMHGRVSNAKIYVCDFNDTDKDGEMGWESASTLESVIGGCRSRQQDSVGLAKGVYYYCNEGTWRLASTLEYDTYHWSDTIDGAWKKGSVVNSNIYVFDESEGAWRTSTTGFDTLSINGCTVKRQLERANIYDEDNETNHCYTCYNKKWYDGNEWSWDLPKEAYLNPEVEYDTIIDARDGKSYKTVKIGDQVWMAENLNYADSNQTPSLKGKSWCYDNNEKYCDVTGRLYTWAAAIDSVALANDSNNPQKCGNGKTCTLSTVVQGVCPSGWHLPSEEEWNLLFTNVGDKHVGKMLKSMNGWENGGNDDNAYGFSALPAGIRYNDGYFRDAGDDAYFWSASEYNSFGACRMLLYYDSEYAYMYYLNKNDGFSVRCLQDN